MTSRSVCLIFFCLLAISSFSQKGYTIKFNIAGIKDTTAYLGYYLLDKNYIKDTARIDYKGEAEFTGSESLKKGLYFLVLNNTRLFDFVIGDDQHFLLSTSSQDYIANMKVSGDTDNKLFFTNLMLESSTYKEVEPLIAMMKDSATTKAKRKEISERFNTLRDKVLKHQSEIIAKHPWTVTATMLKANMPITIPSPPVKTDGTIDSTYQLKWYREHFFDNMDLSNEVVLQLPGNLFKKKIEEYLDKLFLPQADSITKAVDKLIALAKKNQETYKNAVWSCMVKYHTPDIMGLDEVYVNMYDKYFASGEMNYWVSEKTRKTIKDEADRIRRSMIGRVGANLIMLDSDLKPRSMYDIKNKYTILYIFSPDCGFCKEETPKLVNFYKDKKFDVGVYAVSADTSMAKMRNYIKEMNMNWITVNGPRTYVGTYDKLYDAMTTPTLYVLDEKKKIIAKKIPAEKLDEFLTHYEKANQSAVDK